MKLKVLRQDLNSLAIIPVATKTGRVEKITARLKNLNLVGAGWSGIGGKMKTKISSHFLAITCFVLTMASPLTGFGETTGNLVVNISGFPSSEGFAMVALSNSKESYKFGENAAIALTRIRLVDQRAQVIFTNLAYSWYAISIYHDENSNGTMDKNAMGIPKEAYGFSNNARGLFGPPAYKDVMFQLNSAEKQIDIKLD